MDAISDILENDFKIKKNEFYLIGEIGVNHNGSLETAKKIIDLAVDSGCNAVKFQKRTPELCTPDSIKDTLRDTPWGTMTYLEYRTRIEFSQKDYEEIDKYCHDRGIDWFASAWDIDSLNFLDKFKPKYQKVASAMNSNVEFLEAVATKNLPTFLSTGMSDEEDIERALKIFQNKHCPVMLFHTTSTYPASDEILNLAAIAKLQEKFRVPVGYSGHESTVFPSQVAAVLGARVIERHITIDRAMWGSDQSASLSEAGLKELHSSLIRLPKMLGDGVKKIEAGEMDAAKRLRWWIK
jgi:N-acetylneuraminate synthase